MGVIGGVGFTPRILKLTIKHLKKGLKDPNAPFGVDLLLPKIGGGARKTNFDYTKGKLDQLIDVIIESGTKLFVSAVGVPPKHVVDRLHKAGIPVMNMVGHPKHVKYALEAGKYISPTLLILAQTHIPYHIYIYIDIFQVLISFVHKVEKEEVILVMLQQVYYYHNVLIK